MSSIPFKSLTGSLVCFTATLLANDSPNLDTYSQEPKQYRASARHIEGGGIGYEKGYTTFEGFFAPDPNDYRLMPFLDLRGHIFNSGKFAGNVGIGARKRYDCRAYGLNLYYDYRNTHYRTYNQVGLGFETIGNLWDIRLNGYLPVGKKKSEGYSLEFRGFKGNSIQLDEKFQYAMKGLDAEMGFHFGETDSFDFYAAAGPYYFEGEMGKAAIGGKARIAGRYKDYVTLELSNSYDSVFNNKFQAQLTFSIPLGPRTKSDTSRTSCQNAVRMTKRMLQPVSRQEIIVVDKHTKKLTAPEKVIFVDNTSHSLGTYESPYPTLVEAESNSAPGDIIYVLPGNGTSDGMNAGITLKPNQKFWGSGVTQTLATPQGIVTIPQQTSSSPIITNTTGDAVTLASNNQVSGFTISSAFNYGIVGTNPQNIDIASCTLEDSFSDQLHLEYSTSSGIVSLNNLTMTAGLGNQIYILSTASDPLTLTIDDCQFQNTAVYVMDVTSSSAVSASLIDNQFLANTNGSLFDVSGPSTIRVINNTFDGNTSVSDPPITLIPRSTSLTAHFQDNIFSNNEIGGIKIVLDETNTVDLTLMDNSFVDNNSGSGASLGSSIVLDTTGTTLASCQLNLTRNTFSGNAQNSLYTSTNGTISDLEITALNNTFSNNNASGFALGSDGDTLTLNASINTFTELYDHAIGIVGTNPFSNLTITLSNNHISHLHGGACGVAVAQGSSELNLTLQNNEITDCDGTGILCYSSSGFDTMHAVLSNNQINNCVNSGSNAAAGIDIEQYGTMLVTLSDNTLSGNNVSSPGVYVGTTLTAPNACLTLLNNDCSTDYMLVNPVDGTFNLSPLNASASNIGTINTSGTINSVSSCPVP